MKRWPEVCLCALSVVSAGCVEEVKRFDVNLRATRAASVTGGVLQYSYVDNLGIGDGSGVEVVKGLKVGIDATSLRFTVEAVGGDGIGRSAFLPIADGEQLDVHVLVAPLTVGLVSEAPRDLGGNACIAADAAGNVFMLGGSQANEAGYVYEDFAVRSFSEPEILKGVASLGCAAFEGAVAAVGGCNIAVDEVQRITVDGTVTRFPVTLEDACGARAAPAPGGGVWVVDGNGAVTLRNANNTVVFSGDADGSPLAAEVTPAGNLVVLTAAGLTYFSPDAEPRNLARDATALGRRGSELFIVDGNEIKAIDEQKGPERVRGDVPAGTRVFTLLSDNTLVTLEGRTVTVIDRDGSSTTMASPQHTAVVALPGDTVLLLGAAQDGFDGFARR